MTEVQLKEARDMLKRLNELLGPETAAQPAAVAAETQKDAPPAQTTVSSTPPVQEFVSSFLLKEAKPVK